MSKGINLNLFANNLQDFMEKLKLNDDNKTKLDRQTFMSKIYNDASIFDALDVNKDGEITQAEFSIICDSDSNDDGIVTKQEQHDRAMNQAKFFARRTVDKWFSLDVNRDGYWSNVELALGDRRMFGESAHHDTSLDATLTNEELAKKYNMKEEIVKSDMASQMEFFLDGWLEDIKQNIIEQQGVELSKSDMILLKKEMIKQLNTWLMKTGDNKTNNAPLYNSCNSTAYTRLITDEATVSCCGGDVTPPPMSTQAIRDENGNAVHRSCVPVFSSMQEGDTNTSNELKNRLAWAMFNCKSIEEEADMSPLEWQQYKQSWEAVRSMTASDFRNLLKPENKAELENFESTSVMSVHQIVQYIDIVESVTGKDFDSNDWEISCQEFNTICSKVNGTDQDQTLLEGKTRADIPENRKALLTFLEEKGWLYEQFK